VRKADLEVFGPVWDQAPAQQIQAALAGLRIEADHWEQIGRGAVPCRRKVRGRQMWWDRKDELDFAHVGRKTNTAAHAKNIASPERTPIRWTASAGNGSLAQNEQGT